MITCVHNLKMGPEALTRKKKRDDTWTGALSRKLKLHRWLKYALAVSVFIGGLATFLSNFDSALANIQGKCIELNICSPGDYFVNVSIQSMRPSELQSLNLLPDDLGSSLGSTFLDYSGGFAKTDNFRGLDFSPDFSSKFPKENGIPIQSGSQYWKYGVPILDVFVTQNGKRADITRIEVKVENAKRNLTPYVSLDARHDPRVSIQLDNESANPSVDVFLEFNIIGDRPGRCETIDFATENNQGGTGPKYKYKTEIIKVTRESTVFSLSKFMADAVEEFPMYSYRMKYEWWKRWKVNDDHVLEPPFISVSGAEPKGYKRWNTNHPSKVSEETLAGRIVEGMLTATAGDAVYQSYFCTWVTLDTPLASGGGDGLPSMPKVIKLDFSDIGRTKAYSVPYILDEDKPYFRAPLIFFADESGSFDIRLSLRSFDKIIYVSEPIRLNIFHPQHGDDALNSELNEVALKPIPLR